MPNFQIKAEKQPTRCEICHQTDQFDPKTNQCRRCLESWVQISRSNHTANPLHQRISAGSSIFLIVLGFICTDSLFYLAFPYRSGVLANFICACFGWQFVQQEIFGTPECFRMFPRWPDNLVLLVYGIPGLLSFSSLFAFFLIPFIDSQLSRIYCSPTYRFRFQNLTFWKDCFWYWVTHCLRITLGVVLTIGLFLNFVIPTYTLAETIRHDYTVLTTAFLRFGSPIDEPDIHGWTGLMYATLEGNTDLVNLLLSRGANVNHRGNGGQTPLMCASAMGYSDLVELLINHGARINFRDCDGKSALIFALEDEYRDFGHLSLWKAHHDADQNYVRRRKNQTTQVLLKHLPAVTPSLVEEKDYHHKTLLMYAVEGQNPNFVFWLLANGANVNAQNDSGQTPLMLALSNKHEFAYIYFEKLTDRGADIQLKDSNGVSALVYAIQNQQFEATQQLILWGADLNLQLAPDLDLIGLIYARFPRKQAVELVSLISKKQQAVTSQSTPSRK